VPKISKTSGYGIIAGKSTSIEKGSIVMPHIILFEHRDFHGAHKHVFCPEPNLAAGDDNFFNDKVSSFIILEGSWQFFRDINFESPQNIILGPGKYPWVQDIGIQNDTISSLRHL